MRSALRSSAFEIVMLVLFIGWSAVFSASLLSPGAAAFDGRAAGSRAVSVDARNA